MNNRNSREVCSDAALAQAEISEGTWFSLFRIQTAGGTREILRRKNGNIRACKVLPLMVKKKWAKSCSLRGKCSFKRFRRELQQANILQHAQVALLASDRPSTYFSGIDLKANWLYELPGGVVEKGEKVSVAGIREMLEELGVQQSQVRAYATLAGPMAYDSGSHAEFVSVVVALCTGGIQPVAREGIIPEECCMVPFGSLRHFVKRVQKKQYAVEGHVLSAAAQLVF